MNANLQRAIDRLHIQDVYLRNLVAQCAEKFDPKYGSEIDKLEFQSKHHVKRADIMKLEPGERLLLRVFVELGVRWVDTAVADENESVRALIEAEFVAEYSMDEKLDQACMDEFALKNASYHVWPYWRELLMSQCGRMHLPRLALPAVQLAHNRHRESASAAIDTDCTPHVSEQ